MTTDRWQRRIIIAGVGVALVWLVGQVFRDATPATALCFYVPSPAVALVMAGAGMAAAARKRQARWWFAAALPPLVFTLVVDNHSRRNPACPCAGSTLMYWNVGGRPARPGVLETLVSRHADLYALTDVPSFYYADQFREALPNAAQYHTLEFGGLAVVGRGELTDNGWLLHRGEVKVRSVGWRKRGPSATLFLVDLPSNPLVWRDPLLREVVELVEAHRPDLVVGDFNAPRRSRRLADLPAGYSHAYDAVGSGWGYTWPSLLPMLSLDQCIFGPRILPADFVIGRGGDSDHCYEWFKFDVWDE